MTAPVCNDPRAWRVRARHGAAVDFLLYTALDIAPDPTAMVVDSGWLQVNPPTQAASADAGRDFLGALGRRRVVDGAVAARGVAVAAALDAIGVDSGRTLRGRAVGAAVVDVEDVEGMYVPWDVSVCGLG